MHTMGIGICAQPPTTKHARESPHAKIARLQQYLEAQRDRLAAAERADRAQEARFGVFVQCVLLHELEVELDRSRGASVRQDPAAELGVCGWDLRTAGLESGVGEARRALSARQREVAAFCGEMHRPWDGRVRFVKVERVDSPLVEEWVGACEGDSDGAATVVLERGGLV